MSWSAQAATFNFESLGAGVVGQVVALPEGTFTSSDTIFNLSPFYFSGSGGSICPLSSSVFNCQVDMVLDFSSAVTNLKFESVGYGIGDSATISAFNGTSLVGMISGFTDQLLDFTSMGLITKLVFDDSSTAAGYGYGNFSFTQTSAVPIPAALPLLISALGGLGFVARRRARAAK